MSERMQFFLLGARHDDLQRWCVLARVPERYKGSTYSIVRWARRFLLEHAEEYLTGPQGLARILVVGEEDLGNHAWELSLDTMRQEWKDAQRKAGSGPTPEELADALRALVEHEETLRDENADAPVHEAWGDTSAARELLDRYDAARKATS